VPLAFIHNDKEQEIVDFWCEKIKRSRNALDRPCYA
jgi:hypothetical protein